MNEARRNIAVFCPFPPAHSALDAIAGIARYNREHGGWRFSSTNGVPFLPVDLLASWPGDGLIAMGGEAVRRAVAKRRIPAVCLGGPVRRDEAPFSVTTDHFAVGRLVAEHFLSKGLRRFTAVRWEKLVPIVEERFIGFHQALADAGCSCELLAVRYRPLKNGAGRVEFPDFERWMARQTEPVGVFFLHDTYNRDAIEILQRHGVSIPEDMAIVGVSNDPLTCEIDAPLLSSVEPGVERLGYLGAEMLDRLMKGEEPPQRHVVLPPVGIVERHSSNVLAVPDPRLRRALEYIHEHACQGVGVAEMVRALRVDRRMLERQFRAVLGRTPLQEIHRVRIDEARRLLGTTELPVARVAESCGYATQGPLNAAFKRLIGITPRAYRSQQCAWLGGPQDTP
ncbi:MAG: substrate-binding domain-containing protein [Candidatus Sumerlaeota bacterium]|nr:substrate-binding domain-containing protein [Candidatus Sumerlaeota bacterium]